MPQTQTRVDAIVASVEDRLARGLNKVGERLPSVRQAAADEGVSKNTMAEAYDRLVARGLLEARPGSGYYVAYTQPRRASAPAPHVAAAVDLVSLLREQLDRHYAVRPGDGRPPASWAEGSELRRHFARFQAYDAELGDRFGYGSARGFEPLRERLRTMLAERSIAAEPDGVLLTHGANHALDLIIRHLVEPGDTVFVDEPGYYPLFAKLTLARARVVGIRRNADGPDIEDFSAKLAALRPKLFFTQSQAQNPTGGTLEPGVAYALLQAAERSGVTVVENDAFADILPPALTRLAALDRLARVIYVGTFSKTLSASLRCGFLAASPGLVNALADLKILTSVSTSEYVERFVFNLIEGGQYLRHIRRLRGRVEDAGTRTVTALEAIGLDVHPARPQGFFRWVELPATMGELDLCRAAAERSVFLAPGSVFRPRRPEQEAPPSPALRVNVAYGEDPVFLDFLNAYLAHGG